MKKLLFLMITVAALFSFHKLKAQTIAAMTFNIRYDNPNDGDNRWDFRKQAIVSLIEHYEPGILGIQEGLQQQVMFLKSSLPAYNYIGVGREDGKQKGEYSAIFYDTTLYQMIENATFWLSDTPGMVSVGWDAALERICTYGLFQDRGNGKYFWVFNTHFDHMGEKARKMSAQLILNKINEVNTRKLPVMLMGDFNTTAGTEPVALLTTQLLEASKVTQKPLYGPAGTYNKFDPTFIATECIDFIFVSKFTVLSCTHIADKRNDNLCISDHYPVLVEVKF